MKASLILVVCLAAVTVQQNPFWPFQTPFHYVPQLVNYNGHYQPEGSFVDDKVDRADDSTANVYYAGVDPFNAAHGAPLVPYNPLQRYYGVESRNKIDQQQNADTEGRINGASGVDSGALAAAAAAGGPAARIFGALPAFFFLYGNTAFSFSNRFLSTSTFTTTTFITTATVQNCIPLGSFSTDAMSNTFTNQCARRRRAALIEDLDYVDLIEASEAVQVEQSAAPDDLKAKRDVHDLESSKKDEDETYESDPSLRRARFFYLSTTTTTTTSILFNRTTILRTVNVGSSLQCLPSGYTLC